jgi:hypothetical protein
MGTQPRRTKVISNFDEIFKVYRAFNSKHLDKKKFLKSFCFHKNILKILLGVKCKGEKAEFLIAQIAQIALIANDCRLIAKDCQ